MVKTLYFEWCLEVHLEWAFLAPEGTESWTAEVSVEVVIAEVDTTAASTVPLEDLKGWTSAGASHRGALAAGEFLLCSRYLHNSICNVEEDVEEDEVGLGKVEVATDATG